MPRCLLANARCLASADLPVLPFLAPRLFAPSPAVVPWRYARRWNTGGAGSAENRGLEGNVDGMKEEALGAKSRALAKGDGEARGRMRGPRRMSISQKQAQSATRYTPLYSGISGFFRSQSRTGRQAAASRSGRRIIQSKTATQRRQEKIDKDSEQFYAQHYVRRIFSKLSPGSKDSVPPSRGRIQRGYSAPPPAPSSLTNRPSNLKHIMFDSNARLVKRRRYVRALPRGSCVRLSFASGIHPIDNWMKGYAILSSPNDRFFEYPEYPCLELNPECAQWANAFLQTRLSPQLQTRIWRRLRHKKQFELWPAILLWLLQHNCNRAFQFLKLSFTHPYPPSFIAVDTLEYIAQDIEKQINRSQHKQTMAYRQRIAERIEDFLSTFLVYLQQGRRAFAETISQDLVQQVLKLSPDEGVKNLYLDLKTHGVKFDPRTVLAFTARFAELGEHEFGLETLGKAVELGHSPMEDGFIQLSSTVLRSSAMDGKSYHATSSIVARLLELGVCLDTQHYNIIILNAVEARDFQTAWHIYDLMESGDAGLEPDSYTLSILLRGLKHDENPAKHRDFANYCANRALKWKSNWLATEYLHYMYICYKGNGDETIRILRDEYRRFFDLQPLVDLKIFPPNFPSMPGCMTPFRPALFVMIASYLQFASSSLKDDEILSFYTNFRDLVHAGHPVIGPIVETVHTNCAFLLAFCDSPRLLKQAPMIIRDMSSALPKSAIYAAERRPLKMAAPSGITWNIFSHGFAKAGQMAAAEKVVELMRKRNIAPSEVTWATLLNGYARLQNVEKVAGMYSELSRTPEEFKTAGDPRRQAGITLTALGKVRDREQLVKALRWEMGGDAEGWGSVSSMLPPVGLKEFTGGGDSSSMDDEASPVGSKSD